MIYSRLITVLFLFIVLTSFSQEKANKEVLVKNIESVKILYSITNNNTDCVFSINNNSGNTIKFTWDVKVFFSEFDSKEIHKEVIVEPGDRVKISSLNGLTTNDESNLQMKGKKTISQIEVHNVDFKGLQ